MLVGLALFPALALINQVYSRRVEAPGRHHPGPAGRGGDGGPRVVRGRPGGEVAGPRGPRGRPPAPGGGRAAHRPPRGRTPAGHVRAGARRPPQPRDGRPAGGRARGASRPATSRPASWSRRWRCSASSASRCASSGSCWRRCPGPWWRPTGWTRCWRRRAARAPPADAATPLPPGPLTVDVAGLRFGYGDDRCSTASTSRWPRARSWPLVGATGVGQVDACATCSPTSTSRRSGTVRLGGVDLRAAEPDSIRAHVALAFQEAFLFGDTVRENLTLGQPVDDEDVRWALERGPGRPVRVPAAPRPRPAARRAGRDALGWPAPAAGAGPGAAAPSGAADAGRRHVGGRSHHRAADPRRACARRCTPPR